MKNLTAENKQQCAAEAGRVAPRINRSRCEAKADCLRVCPYEVFEIQPVSPEDRQGLGVLAKLKLFMHGNKQAFAVYAEGCHACGLCVQACPENAITLVKV